jgi:hypothetical protein
MSDPTAGPGPGGTPPESSDRFVDRSAPPPRPPAAALLRFLAILAAAAAVLAGFVGIWRAQTQEVSADKAAERSAHERAYGQLAGDGPGAARVRNITITDARIHGAGTEAAGTLAFRVQNSGPPVRLTTVTAEVGGAAVPRVLYVPRPTAEAQPLPAEGLTLTTGQLRTFEPGGPSFLLIGLPTDTVGQRARVTVTFTDVGPVEFEAPIER